MADGITIDRLRLRLPRAAASDPRNLATQIAEALAASAPDLEPGAVVPVLRVRLSQSPGTGTGLARNIAASVLRGLDATGN
jgi:hypothetical protein